VTARELQQRFDFTLPVLIKLGAKAETKGDKIDGVFQQSIQH